MDIMDICRISDIVLFLLSSTQEVDEFGETVMSCIKTLGVPRIASLYDSCPDKQHNSRVKNSLSYYMNHHFRGSKVYSTGEMHALSRHLTSSGLTGVTWRDRHAYIVASQSSFSDGLLTVSGKIRGSCLNTDRLVHVPLLGDFAISRVLDKDGNVLLTGSDTQDALHIPDPLDQEQTWPTDEEIRLANENMGDTDMMDTETLGDNASDAVDIEGHVQPYAHIQSKLARTKRVPKGTSSYQAAWIVDENVDEENEDIEITETHMEQAQQSDEEFEEVDLDEKHVAFDIDEEQERKEYFN
jgi:pre-rRNA-processing protein TSR1